MEYKTSTPFLKWVGGKRQLLSEIRKHYPAKIESYCEPFLGGGAVLFDVIANFAPKNVLINDINPNLVNVYCQVRDNPRKIIAVLKRIDKAYQDKSQEERTVVHNYLRDKYNDSIGLETTHLKIRNAALFIFLNRTCFNGLYRVNKSGKFNVPIGKYKSPLICPEESIKEASRMLQGVAITCGSYESCIDFASENAFFYFDPPYRPISASASFSAYDKSGFNDDDQKNLKEFVDKCVANGSTFLLSNSDPKNVDPNDDFFDTLYEGYDIERVSARRNINSNGNGRSEINEILVYNLPF